MNTIVITADKENVIDQAHFNLWDSSKNKLHFLDIGLLCNNDDYNINIRIPINESVIIDDLAQKLTDKIPNAIFNTYVNVTTSESGIIFRTKEIDKNDNKKFLICPLDMENCINPKNNEIIIHVKKNTKIGKSIKKIYYRFRIVNFDLKKVIIENESKSKSFESSFVSDKILDFRINDTKLMNLFEAQNLISNYTKFNKVHFLYMTDVDKDVQLTSCGSSARFLERGVWDNYLNLTKRKGI